MQQRISYLRFAAHIYSGRLFRPGYLVRHGQRTRNSPPFPPKCSLRLPFFPKKRATPDCMLIVIPPSPFVFTSSPLRRRVRFLPLTILCRRTLIETLLPIQPNPPLPPALPPFKCWKKVPLPFHFPMTVERPVSVCVRFFFPMAHGAHFLKRKVIPTPFPGTMCLKNGPFPFLWHQNVHSFFAFSLPANTLSFFLSPPQKPSVLVLPEMVVAFFLEIGPFQLSIPVKGFD